MKNNFIKSKGIAIIGGGPIGVECAICAKSLGLDVVLYERSEIGAHLQQWGHVSMFSPMGMNVSPLAISILQQQDSQFSPPPSDCLFTGNQYVQQILKPLAASGFLDGVIKQQTEVLAIGRQGLLKSDITQKDRRAQQPFRLLLVDSKGQESTALADYVIDASGVFSQPNYLGDAGMPAMGELENHRRIQYQLPDVLGKDKEHYLGHHSLVVGSGYSAATTVVALAELAKENRNTKVTWVTRSSKSRSEGPIAAIENDRLAVRDNLARQANRLAANHDSAGPVQHLDNTSVLKIKWFEDRQEFRVQLSGSGKYNDEGNYEHSICTQRIIANVGYRPDREIYRELQVHECYATEGPIELAASFLQQDSADCLDQSSCGADVLINPEPNFFIIGSKSYGRSSRFLLSVGLQQVQEIFTLITGQEDLNFQFHSISDNRLTTS